MANSTRKGMNPILAFFLGFLLAFILVGGAVAGVVLFALNYKLDNLSANKDADGNYIYINADPDNGGVGTVLDLIKKVQSVAKDSKNMTLGELEEFIPVVGNLTVKMEEALSEYVRIEEGELSTVKLGELGEFVQTLSERIDIAKLIGAEPNNAILTYLCYGVSSVKYEGGKYVGKYNLSLDEYYECFLELDENGKVCNAYYMEGEERVPTEVLTLDNVNARVDGVCNYLTIGEIMEVPTDDKIFGSIKNSTINTISDDVNALCIQQLFANEVYARKNPEQGETAPDAQMYLAVDPSTPYQTATASDYNPDTIFYKLDGTTPVLAGSNGKLTQEEFDAGSFVTYGAGKILFDPAYLYYWQDEDGDYELLSRNMSNEGRAEDYRDGLYTYGATSKLWKLLLYNDKSDGSGKEEIPYNFQNISSMIGNISKNTETTPLRDLHEAGVLVFKPEEDLETEISWWENGKNETKKIGDMQLGEAIGIFVSLFRTPLPSLPSP